MRFVCFFLVTAASYSTAQAQGTGRGLTAPTNMEFISEQLDHGKGLRNRAGILGTPLVVPYWTQGRVLTVNGPINKVWLKYSLADNQLIWHRPAGDSLEVNTSQVNEFTLGDSLRGSRVTFRRYLNARIEDLTLRTMFFEVCYDAGRSALLRQRTKQVANQSSSGPSLTEGRPPRWQESVRYFVRGTDNRILPVRLNGKEIVAALAPNKEAELTTYVKHEHLSLKREEDVAKLLAYYDSL